MSDPLEVFMKDLLRETKAGNVIITEDNASADLPLPNLMWMHASASSEMSMSVSSLQNSSSSLDSMTSSSGSRWDSIPSIGGACCKQKKAKRERIPSIPRRSKEEDMDKPDKSVASNSHL